MQKNEKSFTKSNSKWIEDVNIKANKTTKLLEENTREKLHGTGLGRNFLAMTPKALEATTMTKNRCGLHQN